jgi:hypothetical protein
MAKIVPATARTPHRSESTIVSEKEQQKNVSSWAEFEKELQAIRNKLLKSGAKVRTGEFSLGSGDHTGEKRLSEGGPEFRLERRFGCPRRKLVKSRNCLVRTQNRVVTSLSLPAWSPPLVC